MSGDVPEPDELLAHRDFVRAIAGSVLRAVDGVDDVEQDTWLAALLHAPRVRSLKSWLGTVARHGALGTLRRGSRRNRREERAAATRSLEVPEPAGILMREETRRRLLEALLLLEEPYRTTLLLRYYDDLSPRAIAVRMDVPVETVRTRLKRGIGRLRARYVAAEGPRGRGLQALAALARVAGPATVMAGGGVVNKSLVAAGVLLLFLGGAALWHLTSYGTAPTDVDRPPVTSTAEATPVAPPTLMHRASPVAPTASPDPTVVGASLAASGFVVDAQGAPIADAEILLRDYSEPRFLQALMDARPVARTDAEGRFALPVPGAPYLTATARGYLPSTVRSRGPATATHITLTRPVARLTGIVRDHSGRGRGGAAVFAFSMAPAASEAWGRTQADGTFSLACTADADVYVSAWAPGHLELRRAPLPLPDANGQRYIEIQLEPAYLIRGRVTDATTGVGIAGARLLSWERFGPVPLSGVDGGFEYEAAATLAHLEARADGYTRGGAGLAYDDDGHATAEIALAPRPLSTVTGVVLDARGSPVHGALVRHADAHTFTGADGTFVLRGATENACIWHPAHGLGAMRLEPGEQSTFSFPLGTALEGVVVEAGGRPAAGAEVTLEPAPGHPQAALLIAALATARLDSGIATSDVSGAFRVPPLPPGPYVLRASPVQGVVAGEAEVPVDLPSSIPGPVRVALPAGLVVAGHVEDPSGQPIAGAVVRIARAGTPADQGIRLRPSGRVERMTRCDGDGHFRLVASVGEPIELRVTAPGHDVWSRTMTADAAPVSVRLRRYVRALIRITENAPPGAVEMHASQHDAKGEHLQGGSAFCVNGVATVELTAAETAFVTLAWKGFRSPRIPIEAAPGDFDVHLSTVLEATSEDPGHVGIPPDVPAGTTPARIDAAARGTLRGRVAGLSQGDAPGLIVFLGGGGNRDVGPDGSFELTVPAGSYEVSCGTWETRGASVRVDVRAGEVTDVQITPPAATGSIRGRVLDGEGVGVGGVSLGAQALSDRNAVAGPTVRCRSGPDGQFAFPFVTARRYVVGGLFLDERGDIVAVNVDVGPASVPLRFVRNGWVRGHLSLEPASSGRIDRVDIVSTEGTWNSTITLQPDGSAYYFEQRLPPGRYRVRAPEGCRWKEEPDLIKIVEGEEASRAALVAVPEG